MEISSNNSLVLYDWEDKVAVKHVGKAEKYSTHRQPLQNYSRNPSNTFSDEPNDGFFTYSFNNLLEFRKADYIGLIIDTYA